MFPQGIEHKNLKKVR